jgi:hypothetical protein
MSQSIYAIALPHPDGEIIALGGKFCQAMNWCPYELDLLTDSLVDVALVQYYYPVELHNVEPNEDVEQEPEAYIVAVVSVASVLPMKKSDEPDSRACYSSDMFTWRLSSVRRPLRALRATAKIGCLYKIDVPDQFMNTLRF